MLAICNPPKDESNAVYDRLQSDGWHTIQFSTLYSHNVRTSAGELDAPKIPGITALSTIRDDWTTYNDEEWPGLKQARRWSNPDHPDFREDLDERWYRRRAGVIPPEGAEAHRPIEREAVEAAWDNETTHTLASADEFATAIDVARSGDRTAAATVSADILKIRYEQQGTNHTEQAERLRSLLADDPTHPIAVDAVGEGSGLEDMLAETYPSTIRFGAGSTPKGETEFYDCWAEGMYHLGQWLKDGGSINDRGLYEELMVAARVLEYEERHLASRGQDGASVLKLTPKDELKDRLGRSPDLLDAAMMAVWARDAGGQSRGVRSYYGDDVDDQEDADSWRGAIQQGGASSYYDGDTS
jgi:hypothetical protein